MRNYAVLHIAADEARIFVTKERAPLMLCIECYRPEELQLLENGKHESTRRRSNSFGTKKPRKFSAGMEDMELPLMDRPSMKKSKVDQMKNSVARKVSKKNEENNPYLSAARNLEIEIDNRASKAIILNEREPKQSIMVTERDFFDAESKIDDIPSNQ